MCQKLQHSEMGMSPSGLNNRSNLGAHAVDAPPGYFIHKDGHIEMPSEVTLFSTHCQHSYDLPSLRNC